MYVRFVGGTDSLSLAVGVTLARVALRLLLLVGSVLGSNHVVTLSASFASSHLRLSPCGDHVVLLLLHLLSLIIGHGCEAELCLGHEGTLPDG